MAWTRKLGSPTSLPGLPTTPPSGSATSSRGPGRPPAPSPRAEPARRRAPLGTRSGMAKFGRPTSVPKGMQATYDAVVRLTDEVCDRHLNAEYRDLARDMAAALGRKRPSPLASGQPRTWACAILYELGRVNFLSDRSSQPHMTLAELRAAFGVSQATASAKARVIANALRVRLFDPEWTLPSLRDQNPLVWMAEVNGLLVDLRDMPREVQEIAFEKGMIPYIPADRE